MNKTTSVSVIIACFERAKELQRLLSSLKKMRFSGSLEIIVVDDGSKNPAAIKEAAQNFGCRLIRLDENSGPAEARNIGVKNSNSEFLWFLDSDTEIENPGLLENMIKCLEENKALAGVGGEAVKINEKTYSVSLHPLPNWLPLTKYLESSKPFEIHPQFISTNNLLVSKKDFLAVNGFSSYFDMCEDQDLCLRLARPGKKFLVRHDTLALHHHSSGGRDGGKFWFFDNARDYVKNLHQARIKMLYAHHPSRLFILPLLDLLFVPAIFVFQAFFVKRNAGDLLKEKSKGSSGGLPIFLFFNLMAVFPAWLTAEKLAIKSLIAKK